MSKKILGIIPARGGSKSVRRKNIRELCGKPLLGHIYESASQSKLLSRLVLSTEDEEIARMARSMGLEVPFMRPPELATDAASTISVIRNVVKFFDAKNEKFDAVVSIQATNPLTKTETIDKAIQLWIDTQCDSVTTISSMTCGHPYTAKRMKESGRIENFVAAPPGVRIDRRQDREPAYFLTGALYLRGRKLIDSNVEGYCLGEDCRGIVTQEVEALDINSEFDFRLIELVMKQESMV